MNKRELQTAANELLRQLDRQVFGGSLDIEKLSLAVGFIEDFIKETWQARAEAAAERQSEEAAYPTIRLLRTEMADQWQAERAGYRGILSTIVNCTGERDTKDAAQTALATGPQPPAQDVPPCTCTWFEGDHVPNSNCPHHGAPAQEKKEK